MQLGAKPASPWVVWDGLTEQRSDAPPGGASIGRARAGGGTLEACNGTQVTFGWESRGSNHTTASASPKTAPWFLQRALLTPRVNPGSHYRCAKSTFKRAGCCPRLEENEAEIRPK